MTDTFAFNNAYQVEVKPSKHCFYFMTKVKKRQLTYSNKETGSRPDAC